MTPQDQRCGSCKKRGTRPCRGRGNLVDLLHSLAKTLKFLQNAHVQALPGQAGEGTPGCCPLSVCGSARLGLGGRRSHPARSQDGGRASEPGGSAGGPPLCRAAAALGELGENDTDLDPLEDGLFMRFPGWGLRSDLRGRAGRYGSWMSRNSCLGGAVPRYQAQEPSFLLMQAKNLAWCPLMLFSVTQSIHRHSSTEEM